LGFTDIPVLASIGVDKTQITCTRKHNGPSQDSYLAAMGVGRIFSRVGGLRDFPKFFQWGGQKW